MRTEIKLNIGGTLSTGDVVGIAYNNSVTFGWFVEPGQYGSLKFIRFQTVTSMTSMYIDFKNGVNTSNWHRKRFANGLTFKSFLKDYIISFGPINNRAFKISNPEEFFKDAGQTESNYLQGKKTLNELKFPAK